jgi:hypothetical protein
LPPNVFLPHLTYYQPRHPKSLLVGNVKTM